MIKDITKIAIMRLLISNGVNLKYLFILSAKSTISPIGCTFINIIFKCVGNQEFLIRKEILSIFCATEIQFPMEPEICKANFSVHAQKPNQVVCWFLTCRK